MAPGDVDAGEAWKIDWTKFGWTIIESLRNMGLTWNKFEKLNQFSKSVKD